MSRNWNKLPKIETPEVVAIFPSLHKPDQYSGGFKVSWGLPKGDPEVEALLENIKEMGQKAAQEVGDMDGKPFKLKKNFNVPWRDGDEINEERVADEKEPYDSYEGMYIFTAKSKKAPRLYIPNGMSTETQIWSGDLIKARLQLDTYSGLGSGINLRINAVKLVEKRAGGDDEWAEDSQVVDQKSQKENDNYDDEDDDDDF